LNYLPVDARSACARDHDVVKLVLLASAASGNRESASTGAVVR
jgi:hypothetical protein